MFRPEKITFLTFAASGLRPHVAQGLYIFGPVLPVPLLKGQGPFLTHKHRGFTYKNRENPYIQACRILVFFSY